MIELYNQADKDNTTRTRFHLYIDNIDGSMVVEFIQREFSDFNKWGKPKVLTDLISTKYLLPEIFSHVSSKRKLEKYITDNFDLKSDIIDEIEDMSKSKQRISISLPTSMPVLRRGIPTSSRMVKDTHLPLIVRIDDKDVSGAFLDFGDFGENAVSFAYNALMTGKIPTTNNDLFYSKGVKNLYEELQQQGM